MKRIALFVLLVFCGFLFVPIAALANNASEVLTEKQKSSSERAEQKLEKVGLDKNMVHVLSSSPLPTVIPTPEYKKLPAYDILPRSARYKKVEV